jgi:hypothetical protein
MTLPSFLLAFVIASLLGTLFHLWKGGGLGRLFFFLLLGWLGFFAGHFLANALRWHFVILGQLQLGSGLFAGIAALLLGDWLSQVNESPG